MFCKLSFDKAPSTEASTSKSTTTISAGFYQHHQNTTIFATTQSTAIEITFSLGSFSQANQSANASTSTATAFDQSTASAGNVTGTTLAKYQPTIGTDTMIKGLMSVNVNTRKQCITTMKKYETKSLEELRMEDYLANRKGPQAEKSADFIFITTQPTGNPRGLFGGSTQQTTGLFGQQSAQQQSKNLFGTNNCGQPDSAFGAPVEPMNCFLGKPFSTPAAPTIGSLGGFFGASTQQTTALLGQQPVQQLTESKTLFGTSNFGQPEPAFGAAVQPMDSFLTKPFSTPATPATGNPEGLFGACTQTTIDLSDQQPAQQPTENKNLFGTSNFGQPEPAFGAPVEQMNYSIGKPISTPAASITGNHGGFFSASTQQKNVLFSQKPAQQPSETKNLFGTSNFVQPKHALGAPVQSMNRILAKPFSTPAASITGNLGGFFGASTQQTTVLLDQQPAQQLTESKNLFGTSNFGQPEPVFGAPVQPMNSILAKPFSTLAASTTGNLVTAFGQPTASAGNATGTTLAKYQPTIGTDTLIKGLLSVNVNTESHCISAMKKYESKSLEELRTEDYLAKRKGPQAAKSADFVFSTTPPAGNVSFFNSCIQPTTNLIGQQPAQQPTENKNLFGTSIFGQPAPAFGAPVQPMDSLLAKPFSTPATPATDLSGQQPAQQPTENKNLFGTSIFGLPAPAFGAPVQPMDILLAKPFSTPATPATANPKGLFDACTQTITDLSGQQPAQQPTENKNLFGTSIFEQPKPAFGAPIQPMNCILAKPFSTPAASVTGNLRGFFGASTQQTTALLDQQPAEQSIENKNLFGTSILQQSAPVFGAPAQPMNCFFGKPFFTPATSTTGFTFESTPADNSANPFGPPAAQNTSSYGFGQTNVTGFDGFGAPAQKNSVFRAPVTDNKSEVELAVSTVNTRNTAAPIFGQTKTPYFGGFSIPSKRNSAFNAPITDNKTVFPASTKSGLFGQMTVPASVATFSFRTSAVNTELNTFNGNTETLRFNTDVSNSITSGLGRFGIRTPEAQFTLSFGASTVGGITILGATPQQNIASNQQTLLKGTTFFGENPAF